MYEKWSEKVGQSFRGLRVARGPACGPSDALLPDRAGFRLFSKQTPKRTRLALDGAES